MPSHPAVVAAEQALADVEAAIAPLVARRDHYYARAGACDREIQSVLAPYRAQLEAAHGVEDKCLGPWEYGGDRSAPAFYHVRLKLVDAGTPRPHRVPHVAWARSMCWKDGIWRPTLSYRDWGTLGYQTVQIDGSTIEEWLRASDTILAAAGWDLSYTPPDGEDVHV